MQHVLYEFYYSLRRILRFFVSIYEWFKKSDKQIPPTPQKTLLQLENEYKDKYLLKFKLLISHPDEIKNANIDPIINDTDLLEELLENKNNELENSWRSRILIENTPRGNVFMFFNIYSKSFSYYCDQSSIPYRVLNSVAMKYVITFKCCAFYKEQIEPEPPQNNIAEVTNSTTNDNKTFVKFKSYNMNISKQNKETDNKQVNKFSYLGKVNNIKFLKAPSKNINPLNGFKSEMIPNNDKLSYSEYKRNALK
jgi:hypothetical protein